MAGPPESAFIGCAGTPEREFTGRMIEFYCLFNPVSPFLSTSGFTNLQVLPTSRYNKRKLV
jgi:hypothetical protein